MYVPLPFAFLEEQRVWDHQRFGVRYGCGMKILNFSGGSGGKVKNPG